MPRLAEGAMEPLMGYSWPGNVRELENVIERALILSKGRPLSFDNIVWPDKDSEKGFPSAREVEFLKLSHVNAAHIRKTLKMTRGRVSGPSGAAALLGVNASTLRHRMRRLGIPFGRGKY